MIITQTVGQDIRSEEMSLIPDSKFQCANTTCLPFISVITTDIRNCQFACLGQSQCIAATFHRSTFDCELFDSMLNQNGNMLADADATSINVISETRFPPGKDIGKNRLRQQHPHPQQHRQQHRQRHPQQHRQRHPQQHRQRHPQQHRQRHPQQHRQQHPQQHRQRHPQQHQRQQQQYSVKWAMTGSMSIGRYYHTASTLANGSVLVAGGYNGSYLNSAELYNPLTGTWAITGSMRVARQEHTAIT
ncbi:unnamed protein product [Adineta steineri]|uniref:Apple domain-containing protein n=1 Tax=Adineta steineri TaxID=433720 RepID=A0A814MET0_9BILA|nr:unnamed protein product [Adineta steineri]CAF3723374.1 unnamed protein product [Adineta steineri]